MGTYIFRRMLWLPIILLIVSAITFALGRFGPGDPVELLLGQYSNPAVVERIREQRGLNDNIAVQYGRYLSEVIRGDFGESFKYRGRSVADLLKKKMWVSAQLNIAALIISVGLGVPIGLYAALKQGTWVDTAVVFTVLGWQSVPVFLTAPAALLIFAAFRLAPHPRMGRLFRYQDHPSGVSRWHTGCGLLHPAYPGQHPGGHLPRLHPDRPG